MTSTTVMPRCIAAQEDEDIKPISKILQLLKSLADSVPAMFENGEAACIAPFVVLLFPMLNGYKYSKVRDDVLETLDSLILLSVSKDIWSVKVLLEDSSILYEKISRTNRTSLDTSSSKLMCLEHYLKDISQQENQNLECVIYSEDYENKTALRSSLESIFHRIICIAPHFFQDKVRY